jgi:hypothetical protein
MALILDSLYDALKAAGASEEEARAAARDVAGCDNRANRLERDANLLKWMVGVVIAVQLGTFWMQWQVVDRLSGIEARLSAIEPDPRPSSAALQISGIDQDQRR